MPPIPGPAAPSRHVPSALKIPSTNARAVAGLFSGSVASPAAIARLNSAAHPRQQLLRHPRQRKDVRPFRRLTRNLFGRPICWRPGRLSRLAFTLDLRKPEVDNRYPNLSPRPLLHYDVLRLEIQMQHARLMRGLQDFAHLPQQLSPQCPCDTGPSRRTSRSVRPRQYCITT